TISTYLRPDSSLIMFMSSLELSPAPQPMANAAHKPTIVNPSFGCIAPLLLNLEKLDFKRQLGVGRDNSGIAALAVAEFGGNRKLAFASGLHSRDSLIPALDNLTCAELESER